MTTAPASLAPALAALRGDGLDAYAGLIERAASGGSVSTVREAAHAVSLMVGGGEREAVRFGSWERVAKLGDIRRAVEALIVESIEAELAVAS